MLQYVTYQSILGPSPSEDSVGDDNAIEQDQEQLMLWWPLQSWTIVLILFIGSTSHMLE